MDEKVKDQARINGYLEKELYTKFRIKLLKMGKSFNQWLREQIEKELEKK